MPDKAVELVTQKVRGANLGGKTLSLGLKDGCVSISDSDKVQAIWGRDLASKYKAMRTAIVEGKITPPGDQAAYNAFTAAK